MLTRILIIWKTTIGIDREDQEELLGLTTWTSGETHMGKGWEQKINMIKANREELNMSLSAAFVFKNKR